jgi:hypothetical protein
VALLEKRGFLYNHSGDFPQVILIVPSHVPNRRDFYNLYGTLLLFWLYTFLFLFPLALVGVKISVLRKFSIVKNTLSQQPSPS